MAEEVAKIYGKLEERGIPTIQTHYARFECPNSEATERYIKKQGGVIEFLDLDFPENFLVKVKSLDKLRDKMSIPEFTVGGVEIKIGKKGRELGNLRIDFKEGEEKMCQEIDEIDEKYRSQVIEVMTGLGYKFIGVQKNSA